MQRIREATVEAKRSRRREAGELRGIRPPGSWLVPGGAAGTLGPGWGARDVEQHLAGPGRSGRERVASIAVQLYSGLAGSAGLNDDGGSAGATSRPHEVDPNELAPSAPPSESRSWSRLECSPVRAGSALNPSVRPSARASRAVAPRPSSTTATTSRRKRTPRAGFSSCGGDARARAPRRRGRCRSGRWATGARFRPRLSNRLGP